MKKNIAHLTLAACVLAANSFAGDADFNSKDGVQAALRSASQAAAAAPSPDRTIMLSVNGLSKGLRLSGAGPFSGELNDIALRDGDEKRLEFKTGGLFSEIKTAVIVRLESCGESAGAACRPGDMVVRLSSPDSTVTVTPPVIILSAADNYRSTDGSDVRYAGGLFSYYLLFSLPPAPLPSWNLL